MFVSCLLISTTVPGPALEVTHDLAPLYVYKMCGLAPCTYKESPYTPTVLPFDAFIVDPNDGCIAPLTYTLWDVTTNTDFTVFPVSNLIRSPLPVWISINSTTRKITIDSQDMALDKTYVFEIVSSYPGVTVTAS